MTFSSKIRQELAQRHRQHAKEPDWALASFASFAASLGKIREEESGWELTLRVTNGPTVSLLETIIPSLGFSSWPRALCPTRPPAATAWLFRPRQEEPSPS